MNKNLFDLSGKVAIVTGGNGGIGYGISVGLAQAGANIMIAARNQEKIDSSLGNLRKLNTKSSGLTVDVTNEDSVINMVDQTINEFGKVDILINNASMTIRKTPEQYSYFEWQEILNVNLTSTFLCSRTVYPHMAKSHNGKIINIGSMTSIFGHDLSSAYAASKGGVTQLTKSLAIAWSKDNIQVNSILPGWVNTDLTYPIRSQPDMRDRYDLISSRIPQRRWGDPEDIAGTAIFLSSDASNYVTGVSIPVDGGYSIF